MAGMRSFRYCSICCLNEAEQDALSGISYTLINRLEKIKLFHNSLLLMELNVFLQSVKAIEEMCSCLRFLLFCAIFILCIQHYATIYFSFTRNL